MTTNDDQNPTTSGLPSYGSVPPPPEGSYPPPPPPPGAPAPGGYGGVPPYSAPEAIGYGWRKFKDNAGPMVLATLLVVVVALALAFMSEIIAPSPTMFASDGTFEFDGGGLGASLVAQTIVGAVSYVLFAMLVKGSLDVVDGGNFDMSKAFGALNFGKVLLAGLLLSIVTTVGFFPCFLPGILFAIFSFFTIYFVVDEDEDPVQSILASFKLVGANFGNALLTGLLTFLVLLAGAILCGVGLLAAIPVVYIAGAYAFRRFRGQPVAP